MLRKRVIPILLLKDESLIKTVQYKKFQYIGDPVNTCRIFNELEVDELCFLDVFASVDNRKPNFKVLQEIANECFMPLSYGGGITTINEIEKILKIGFEKIIFNSATFQNPNLIKEAVKIFGSQAIVGSIDVKKNIFGKYSVYGLHGTTNYKESPEKWLVEVESMGVGEILVNNIDKEGTWEGIDEKLVELLANISNVPIIAHGGIKSVEDVKNILIHTNVSAVAVGSLVVFQKKGMGVLINMPNFK